MDERDDDVIERFEGEQGLVDVLYTLGVGDNERNKIVDDGLDSTEVLILSKKNAAGNWSPLRGGSHWDANKKEKTRLQ